MNFNNLFIRTSNNIVGSGNITSKTVILEKEVNSLICSGSIDVEIVGGDALRAKIIADDNIIDLIVIDQQASAISIGIKPNSSFTTNSPMKVILTVPTSLTYITAKGSTSVHVISESCKKLEFIEASGASSIEVDNVNTIKLTINTKGASTVKLKSGQIQIASFESSGSSDIAAYNIDSIRAKVHASGASDIRLTVKESLDVSASGSATVRYKGNPQKLTKSTSGVGEIKQK